MQSPYRPARATVPTWVMGAVALAAIGGLFIWFSTSLNAASDEVFAQLLGAPLAHMPQITRAAPVRPPPPAAAGACCADPLYVFLKPEIDQGLVTVLGSRAVPIVRIRNTGMFASGSATVSPAYYRLLQRIGEALKAEKGAVTVDGYTDNQPIHTVQFPSNFQLSTARAEAARALIVRRSATPTASRRRVTRMPIRWRPMPRRKAAKRTAASKSCCGGRPSPCVRFCAFWAPAGS